jgi:hypothetical protein
MPHTPGHSPHGGFTTSTPKPKPKTKPRPKPPQGFQSPGYVPPKDRLKTSQGNKDYIPPAPGGTIITTTAGGGETREYLDQGGNVVNTQIIPPPDDKKDDKKTTTKTTDDDETRKNTFLSKILGVPITELSSQDLAKVKKILEDYEKNKLNLNIAQLRSLMVKNIVGGVFGKSQIFSDRDGNPVDPDKVIDRGDGRLFFINEKGEEIDVRRTREGVIEQLEDIDPTIMQSLKKFNPEVYYPFAGSPQTSGGLVDLASLDATKFGSRTLPDGSPNPDYNPDFANQIFAARQELRRMDKNPFTGTSTRDEGLGQFAQGPATQAPPPGSGTTPPNPGDLIFRTMYRPNFTPSYTGGPEQIQLAGGFFDPVTKKPVFDPYGTANLYKFSEGGIANFKNYGY